MRMSFRQIKAFGYDLQKECLAIAEIEGLTPTAADLAEANSEMDTWTSDWSQGTQKRASGLAGVASKVAQSNVLLSHGFGHSEYQTFRRKMNASTKEKYLRSFNLTVTSTAPTRTTAPPRTTMVSGVQPPTVQPPVAPAPAPAPAGPSPLDVFNRIAAMKAAGMTDDQIRLVLGF